MVEGQVPSLYQKNFEVSHLPRAVDERARDPGLIARDKKIRELHAQGESYPQIARKLGIAVGTAWNAVNRDQD